MNCGEIERLLGPYRDGELDPERRAEVAAHQRHCEDCRAALERLEQLSAAIESAPRYPASPELRARLESRFADTRQPYGRWLLLAAGLATAALVIGRLTPVADLRPQDALANEVVRAHLRSLVAGHLWDVAASGHHTVKPWLAAKLDFPFDVEDISSRGLRLAGARVDSVDGRTVAVLVYRRGGHIISVFVWPAAQPPDRPPAGRSVHGFNVIDWRADGLNWWAVSDLKLGELNELPLSPCFLPAHETLGG